MLILSGHFCVCCRYTVIGTYVGMALGCILHIQMFYDRATLLCAGEVSEICCCTASQSPRIARHNLHRKTRWMSWVATVFLQLLPSCCIITVFIVSSLKCWMCIQFPCPAVFGAGADAGNRSGRRPDRPLRSPVQGKPALSSCPHWSCVDYSSLFFMTMSSNVMMFSLAMILSLVFFRLPD